MLPGILIFQWNQVRKPSKTSHQNKTLTITTATTKLTVEFAFKNIQITFECIFRKSTQQQTQLV